MDIVIKYSVSDYPHRYELDRGELDIMASTGNLVVVQDTPKGTKTLTITGTKRELEKLAEALIKAAT